MTDVDRQPARSQSLPSSEVRILRKLEGYTLYSRVRELYMLGWTLRSIGEAFKPRRPRSTIRYWVSKAVPIASAVHTTLPEAPAPTPVKPKNHRKYRTLTNKEILEIRELSPLARKFRAAMGADHPAAIANEQLTKLCKEHHRTHVPTRDLAIAAGVSYRAMARRVGK